MTGTVYSTNERAEQLLGRRRSDVVAFDLPADLGYICPVHRIVDDERLHWSEYNGFVWCETCDRDYPSVLCIDLTAAPDPERTWRHAGIDSAINTYLNTIADAIHRATTPPTPAPPTPSDETTATSITITDQQAIILMPHPADDTSIGQPINIVGLNTDTPVILTECVPITACADNTHHMCIAGGDLIEHWPLNSRDPDDTEHVHTGQAGGAVPGQWAWILTTDQPADRTTP